MKKLNMLFASVIVFMLIVIGCSYAEPDTTTTETYIISGNVTNVTATSPITSTGGSTPDIGIIPYYLQLSGGTMTGTIIANGASVNILKTGTGENDYCYIAGYNGTDYKQVQKIQNGSDPYVSFGGSQQNKFYNSGYADFAGNLYLGSFLQLDEIATPATSSANTTRVFAKGGIDELMDLCAIFPDGTVDIFAEETTPIDSPIFRYFSNTELKLKIIKPHSGIIQFVAEFPDGTGFVLKEYQYHDTAKINANLGADNPLPNNWVSETQAERLARIEAELEAIKAETQFPQHNGYSYNGN